VNGTKLDLCRAALADNYAVFAVPVDGSQVNNSMLVFDLIGKCWVGEWSGIEAHSLLSDSGFMYAIDAGGMVLRRSVVIRNSRGLHARAAAKLVTLAERYSACVNVLRDGQSVPAVSIMGLMMLGAGRGAEIVIQAEGWDAKEALDAVAALVEAGFHED
jgi:phosphocarrier protein